MILILRSLDIYLLTLWVFVSPDVSFLPQDVDVELLPEAEVHTGGMNFVEQDVHRPGSEERCPSNHHHHPHLILNKHLLYINKRPVR